MYLLILVQGYTVFSIPVGVVYRPNEAKVRNLKTKDYLGKARLVAASDRANAFTGFAGSEIKNVRCTSITPWWPEYAGCLLDGFRIPYLPLLVALLFRLGKLK